MKPEMMHPLVDVYGRLGFLLRRGHQIAVSVFSDACREYAITPPQHGVLLLASRVPGIDQAGVSRLMGLDKSTSALIISNLARRRLLVRKSDPHDLRRYHLEVTRRGLKLLEEVSGCVAAAQQRLVAPFSAEERETLSELLGRLVQTFNDSTRAPIDNSAYYIAQLRREKRRGRCR